jgi:hypothetical protein
LRKVRGLFFASVAPPVIRQWLVEPDCVAGHVRFELRNVAANYLFERSHKFSKRLLVSTEKHYIGKSDRVAEDAVSCELVST